MLTFPPFLDGLGYLAQRRVATSLVLSAASQDGGPDIMAWLQTSPSFTPQSFYYSGLCAITERTKFSAGLGTMLTTFPQGYNHKSCAQLSINQLLCVYLFPFLSTLTQGDSVNAGFLQEDNWDSAGFSSHYMAFEAGAKKVIPQLTDDKQYINTANIANSRHLKYQKVVFEYVVHMSSHIYIYQHWPVNRRQTLSSFLGII